MKKILLTLATVFALTACGGGAPSPTGDAEKDAKAAVEYMMSEADKCKTLEELYNVEKKIEPMQKTFEDYKKDHQNTKRNSKRQLQAKCLNMWEQ